LQSLGVCDYPYRVDCGNSTSAYPTEAPIAAEGAQQQPGAAGEKVPEEVWRQFYQEQFHLPANAASGSAYYGGFAHLPPVQVAPGKHQNTFLLHLVSASCNANHEFLSNC